jgi:hypothetical protein
MTTATLRLYKRLRPSLLIGRWARIGCLHALGYAYAFVLACNPYRRRHWNKYWLGGG